ncbi:MAG TPA: MarR family winged helix-turn-helix transcriptional regulator [Solirubrobacterales bacterium]|nr:MarR family winged helix-turn-helix transcriptional regulator [Solirubrobacterales bacterium]
MSQAPENTDFWIPMAGLFEIAKDAFFEDFREELEQTEFGEIRPTHGCVFRFVRGEGMRLTVLAEMAGMTKQSVGEIVDDLVARGYVKRIPDPEDKRAKLICLTERGERAQATGLALFAKVEEQWKERYGDRRITQLRKLLEEIAAAEAPLAAPELVAREPANA